MKNVSMGGAALVVLYLFKQFGDALGLTVSPEALLVTSRQVVCGDECTILA